MVAEKTAANIEAPEFSSLETIEIQAPLEQVEELLLDHVLPPQIATLEAIAECLDEGHWEEAFERGLLGTMGTLGKNFERVENGGFDTLSPLARQYHDTAASVEMAMRIMESSGTHTLEEQDSATKNAAGELKIFIRSIRELA